MNPIGHTANHPGVVFSRSDFASGFQLRIKHLLKGPRGVQIRFGAFCVIDELQSPTRALNPMKNIKIKKLIFLEGQNPYIF